MTNIHSKPKSERKYPGNLKKKKKKKNQSTLEHKNDQKYPLSLKMTKYPISTKKIYTHTS